MIAGTILDLANDAIFVHDALTGVIVDVNRRAADMYGYTREDLCRLSVAALSEGDPAIAQARATELLRAAAGGVPQLFEWRARTRGGEGFWVEVNLKRVAIDGRDCLLAIVRDITERKRDELEIRRAHASQKTVNALLRLALEDVRLEELLEQALSLVLEAGWPPTCGMGAIFLNGPEGRLVCEAQIGFADHASVECGCRAAGDYCITIAAGGTKLGALKVVLPPNHVLDPTEAGFFDLFASTLAGIIVRHRAVQDLRRADDQLREQAALVRLGEMAAVVAHEVRNPLAGVRGVIQVIGGRLPADSRDAAVIGDVVARLDALDELMTDLLLFARPPQAQFAPVDLLALARETTNLVAQDSHARNVEFLVEGESPSINADPKLLRSVLMNLLLNATHAVQQSGTVRTSIAATEGACVVTVSDTGPGIPAHVRDRIFVPFFTTKARGTGLGLPTAKRLVEAHRGRISVQCPAGGGTRVTIELPRA